MKTTKIQKIYTGVFIFTAGMAFCTQAALAPENILLDDTLMVITCRDLNKSKSYITEGTTPLGMLLKDPAMQPFCNAIKEQIGTFKSELTKALDEKNIKWEEFQNNLFKGGISLSITGFQSIQKDSSDADSLLESFFFQPLIMAEFNSDNQKIKELFDKVEFTYGTENVADTEFISVNLNEKGTLWMGVKDSILYVTHSMNEGDDRKLSLENLTKIIDKPSDRSTLAQTERFKEQENITPETDYLWVNLEMITESVKEFVLLKDKEYVAPEAGSMEALVANARPLAIYNALGISAFKSFSISSQIENGEGFSTMSVACPSTERRGISALIDIYKKLDCTPAAFIPANIISYSIAQIDLPKAWEIISGTAMETIGLTKVMLPTIKAQIENSPEKIDLQKGLLENLTGEFIVINFPGDISSMEEIEQAYNAIILLGVKDTELFKSTINNSFKLLNPESAEEIISDLYTDTLFLDKIEGYIVVVLGNLTPEIQAYLDANGVMENKLADNKSLKAASARLGGFEQYAFSYTDQQQLFKQFSKAWNLIGELIYREIEEKGCDYLPTIKDIIAKLPAEEVFLKYLGFSISGLTIDDSGCEIKYYYPMPESIKK